MLDLMGWRCSGALSDLFGRFANNKWRLTAARLTAEPTDLELLPRTNRPT